MFGAVSKEGLNPGKTPAPKPDIQSKDGVTRISHTQLRCLVVVSRAHSLLSIGRELEYQNCEGPFKKRGGPHYLKDHKIKRKLVNKFSKTIAGTIVSCAAAV